MKPEDRAIADHFSRLRVAHATHDGEVLRADLQTEMSVLRAAHAWLADIFPPMRWETGEE